MTSHKKPEQKAEVPSQQPIIPQNNYPFSRSYAGNITSATTAATSSVTEQAPPFTSLSSTASIQSDKPQAAGTDKNVTSEESAPYADEQDFDFSRKENEQPGTQDSISADEPVVSLHAHPSDNLAGTDDKKPPVELSTSVHAAESGHSAHTPPDQATVTPAKVIPGPACDPGYLTVDEAQAYIDGPSPFGIATPVDIPAGIPSSEKAADSSPASDTETGPSELTKQSSSTDSTDTGAPAAFTPLAAAVLHQQTGINGQAAQQETAAGEAVKPETEPTATLSATKKTSEQKAAEKIVSTNKTTDKAGVNQTAATPSKQSFFSSHPILSTTSSMPGGFSTRVFNGLSLAPWLILTVLFVLQTIFTLDARSLWYSDEVRHAAVFTSMLDNGYFFKLELNGQPYPDKPSLYFWFLRGLYELVQMEGPRLYFGAAAISGLIYLWVSLLMGRLVGRFDGRSLLAGGILLISGGYFMGVTHYARMDLLFAALIIASYTALFIAFSKNRAPVLMVTGFILAALACLTKGPLGIAFPLATLALFAIWRGKVRRLFSLDILLGCAAAVIIVGGWLAGLYHETDLNYIQHEIIGGQVIERAIDAQHHRAKWAYYIERLPILLLPWVSIIFCLPFHRLLSKSTRDAIKASRTSEREGQAFLWCIVISSLLLLSAISTKIIIYMLPALPAMCLLAGRGVLHLSGKRALLFKILLGITLLFAGVILLVGAMKLFGSFDLPDYIDKQLPAWQIPPSAGFLITTCILCGTALFLLIGYRSSRPEGTLLTLAFMSVAIAYPLFGLAAPSLDAILSPKAQGEIFKRYSNEGYQPYTFSLYGGTYTYYAGRNIEKLDSLQEIEALLEKHPKIIIALQQRALDKWISKPECFQPVNRQMIEQHEYVLLACPPLPEIEASDALLPASPLPVDGQRDGTIQEQTEHGQKEQGQAEQKMQEQAPQEQTVQEQAGTPIDAGEPEATLPPATHQPSSGQKTDSAASPTPADEKLIPPDNENGTQEMPAGGVEPGSTPGPTTDNTTEGTNTMRIDPSANQTPPEEKPAPAASSPSAQKKDSSSKDIPQDGSANELPDELPAGNTTGEKSVENATDKGHGENRLQDSI